jgi:hypothetical protein
MSKLTSNFLDNWQTSLTGVVLAVTVLLSALGVFTPEQATGVQTQAQVIFGAVAQIVAGISALVLLFKAKD